MPLERPFGREISNLIDLSRPKQASKLLHHPIGARNISVEDLKARKPCSSHITLQENPKVHKPSTTLREDPKTITLREDAKPSSRKTKELQNYQLCLGEAALLPDYFSECFRHMLAEENAKYNLYRYIDNQAEITSKTRGVLIDWLVDLHFKYKMFSDTLFIMVSIIDSYLVKNDLPRSRLQLLGIAAFFVASKYEETYKVPQLGDLVHLSANLYSKQEILNMEAEIIMNLNFQLTISTSYKFFEPLSKMVRMDPKNVSLSHYILQLALLNPSILKYKPSIVACASIVLVNKMRKVSECWPEAMVTLTGYKENELKSCAKELCLILEGVDSQSITKCIRRKFSLAKFNEVARIKIERKQK